MTAAAASASTMRIGLRAAVERLGDYTIDRERLTWRTSLAFRGPTALYLSR